MKKIFYSLVCMVTVLVFTIGCYNKSNVNATVTADSTCIVVDTLTSDSTMHICDSTSVTCADSVN